jgi:hypothetical protein
MNLQQLVTEVEAHGFDPNQYGARVVNYLNDAYLLVCRRVDYYMDETTETIATTAGQSSFPWPANMARIRSVLDTDRNVELQAVGDRDIDRSQPTQGTPNYYAQDGPNIRIYPTADGVHNLLFRYWLLPSVLVNSTDTPTLPADWHRMLSEYAIARCFWADDDATMGQAWDQKFLMTLSEFTADVRFPSTDYPTQAEGMWNQERSLGGNSWTLYGSGYF